jgi:hypothetical protein
MIYSYSLVKDPFHQYPLSAQKGWGKKNIFYPTIRSYRGVLHQTTLFHLNSTYMKSFNHHHIIPLIAICFLSALGGCDKVPVDKNTGHYLRFSNAHVNVTNKQGDTRTFTVESDIAWKLTVSAPVPDWMVLDKNSGNGNETVTVTATRDNNSRGYRFAEVIGISINDPSIQPVRITVVQYDSTFKVK